MGHTPNRVDRLLIRTTTAARAGMATTADISTQVHPANSRGKRISGSRCHHQHQPWSIPLTDQPILTAHMCRHGSAVRFVAVSRSGILKTVACEHGPRTQLVA